MTMESTTSESTEANTTEPTEVAMEITSNPETKPKASFITYLVFNIIFKCIFRKEF